MFVAMVATECAPVVKIGGLADVVEGLSHELEQREHQVEIVLPKYDCMHYDTISDFQIVYRDLQVPWYDGAIFCDVWGGSVSGKRCLFIDPHSHESFFNRGVVYGHGDDVFRFGFFCKAALEFLKESGREPDIIHCHDWQTALLPVLLEETYRSKGMTHPRVCLTIHNFKHQGYASDGLLAATGLARPDYFFQQGRLRDNANPFSLNLLKGGIVYSSFVATVSPHHAWEARFSDHGFGLQETLHIHQNKFGGVLNGIDCGDWNPEKDERIPHRYSVETIENKYGNKAALRRRLLLRDAFAPIIAFIGRLDPQKGLDLVRHALFYALDHGAQFVLLGSGTSTEINDSWMAMKRRMNDHHDCRLEIGFDDALAHLIYAGADMIVVPSLFEPCGLAQMIAMRYGAVPVVRSVGGLVDTVFDVNHSDRPPSERNGFVFHTADFPGIESALDRAIGLWNLYPDRFRAVMINGMRHDFSWRVPAEHYINIYNHIRRG